MTIDQHVCSKAAMHLRAPPRLLAPNLPTAQKRLCPKHALSWPLAQLAQHPGLAPLEQLYVLSLTRT